MKTTLKVFIIAALTCILCGITQSAVAGNGTVTVESREVVAGSDFTLDVTFSGNSETVTSVRVPLKFNSSYLTCTNVTFDGSLLASGMESDFDISDGQVVISYVPPVTNPMPSFGSSSGLLATVHFTVSSSAPGGDLTVDSIYVDDEISQFGTIFHRWTRVDMTNYDGSMTLEPAFEAGVVTVLKPTDVDDGLTSLIPTEYALDQNYPNPFNPMTTIGFALPERAEVRLEVFNLLGQHIALLVDEVLPAGYHQVEWNGSDTPSGVYFYKISANSTTKTRKMVLLK